MKPLFRRLACGLMLLSGCSSWDPFTVRSQSPDESEPEQAKASFVGDLAVPFGMFPVEVESVGLVVNLDNTGDDPAPSPQRSLLVNEMQTRGVKNPNAILASPQTTLVLVRGKIPPGIQKGEHFDVEVRVQSNSEATSLRGGKMLEARLREMAVLGGQFHEGRVLALASGPVIVDPSATGKEDRVMLCRGRILGGGSILKSRPMGLVLTPEHQSVFTASRVATAVNKRFHTFDKGIQVGVAKAKTDEFIELTIHPKYKNNIPRYVQVVRAVALQETPNERMQRIADLKNHLLEPSTASAAALQLEAIGKDGVDVLKEAILSSNREVRFYAAESLAYLDCSEAAGPLAEAARNEPAFRVFALTALGVMDNFAACERLRDLMSGSSAETRYGAFRALWTMNPADPAILGERLGDEFSYHVVNADGPPMVHLTRSRRPELVLFGEQQRLLTPLTVNAGPHIMVTSQGGDKVSVSRFSPNEPDRRREVPADLDQVIRAIVDVGGSYPDVVQALQEAKAGGSLPSRLEIDALPEAGRSYDRDAQEGGDSNPDGDSVAKHADSPEDTLPSEKDTPTETGDDTHAGAKAPKDSSKSGANRSKSDKKPGAIPRLFAKMIGRDQK